MTLEQLIAERDRLMQFWHMRRYGCNHGCVLSTINWQPWMGDRLDELDTLIADEAWIIEYHAAKWDAFMGFMERYFAWSGTCEDYAVWFRHGQPHPIQRTEQSRWPL